LRCQRSFYNIKKGSFSERAPSFGYGNKLDLINREGVPPPGAYTQNSEFATSKDKKRGFSFGNDKREFFSQEVDFTNPGPGKYDKVYNNYSRVSFSIRSKYEDPLEKHKNVKKKSFSTSDLDNIIAHRVSILPELISIQNIEGLNAEKWADRPASKRKGKFLLGPENTQTSFP
jgi:hypothetical protein